jgi:hypothetical protein
MSGARKAAEVKEATSPSLIEKIAVNCYPKIPVRMSRLRRMADSAVSKVARKMAVQ